MRFSARQNSMKYAAMALTLLASGLSRASAVYAQAVPRAETQAGMNAAAGKDFARADAEMNRAYKKLMAGLDARTRAKLQASQRQWFRFRDTEAASLSMKVEGGSVYPMVYASHRASLTRTRTKALNDADKTFHTEGML